MCAFISIYMFNLIHSDFNSGHCFSIVTCYILLIIFLISIKTYACMPIRWNLPFVNNVIIINMKLQIENLSFDIKM